MTTVTDLTNHTNLNPFDEAVHNYVHIKLQQRNGKKCITILQGLPNELNFNKILKAFKKSFNCNGTTVVDEKHGIVVQLSGDQRKNCQSFLIKQDIVKSECIKIHGS